MKTHCKSQKAEFTPIEQEDKVVAFDGEQIHIEGVVYRDTEGYCISLIQKVTKQKGCHLAAIQKIMKGKIVGIGSCACLMREFPD